MKCVCNWQRRSKGCTCNVILVLKKMFSIKKSGVFLDKLSRIFSAFEILIASIKLMNSEHLWMDESGRAPVKP